jgi:hypothetical protein
LTHIDIFELRIQILRAYLCVFFHDNQIPIKSFSISTNYPKRVLEDGSETLEKAVREQRICFIFSE